MKQFTGHSVQPRRLSSADTARARYGAATIFCTLYFRPARKEVDSLTFPNGPPTLSAGMSLSVYYDGGELRLLVNALATDTIVGQGIARVSDSQTEIRGLPELPSDRDGDGVLAEIDRCPDWPDPTQIGACGRHSQR